MPHTTNSQRIQTWLHATICLVVDYPQCVELEDKSKEKDRSHFLVRVHPSDAGKLIGTKGRNIRSIRSLLMAAGGRFQHPTSFYLEHE